MVLLQNLIVAYQVNISLPFYWNLKISCIGQVNKLHISIVWEERCGTKTIVLRDFFFYNTVTKYWRQSTPLYWYNIPPSLKQLSRSSDVSKTINNLNHYKDIKIRSNMSHLNSTWWLNLTKRGLKIYLQYSVVKTWYLTTTFKWYVT